MAAPNDLILIFNQWHPHPCHSEVQSADESPPEETPR